MSTMMHDNSTTTTDCEPLWVQSDKVQPISCQPWCARNDGHPDEVAEVDQQCVGREHRLPLRLEEPIEGLQHDFLSVYPVKAFGAEPFIELARGELHGVKMTPDEAGILAQELLFAVARIKGQS